MRTEVAPITGLSLALAACGERETFPDEERVIVSADPEVPFAEVARAIVAARGTEAAPLFPRTVLAAGVR